MTHTLIAHALFQNLIFLRYRLEDVRIVYFGVVMGNVIPSDEVQLLLSKYAGLNVNI